jgi:2-desacetyl-2-hydroxyethyl bacteriochlorophyllide A dehydrogenase
MDAMQIRQVVLRAPEQLEVITTQAPHPGPGEVRVRTTVVGICGSDLHAWHGAHPFIELPVSPGHEVVGVIETVDPGVTDFSVGERVLVEPNLVCGACVYCRSGRYNLCDRLQVLGCQTAGGMADLFTVPAGRLHLVPDGMTDAEAALVEPLSTATHAIRLAGADRSGLRVAILGAGTIGLLTLIAAREAGAAAIVVTDLQPSKLERARRLGARDAIDPRSETAVKQIKEALGARPDVTVDCVSTQASINQAIALAQKGGTVMVVGVATRPVQIPLPIIQDQEIRLEGSAMYVRQDVQRAIELVRAGVVPVEEIVTATYSLEEAPEAFAAADSGQQVKVQLACV